MIALDKRAKKILFGTYWKNGWIDTKNRSVTPDDFSYAKSKGVMFDSLTISHDHLVEQIVSLVNHMPKEKPAVAFLSSLSTDRADWRSGLASWHFAKALNFHVYKEEAKVTGYYYEAGVSKPHIRHTCAICGADGAYANEDLNVLNFERIRWGGVRHGSWIYTLLDLQQLYESEIPNPTNEDILIFEKILQTIASSASNDHPGTLRDRLGSVLRATKDQRSTLLEILAAVGVLRPQSTDRPNTGGRNDWKFVEYWRGEDGYDEQALHEYFHKVE